MGYSNNKWRKILTILMIINLCFILFAKISKVFAVSQYSTILQSDINIPDWLYDYNFVCSIKDNSGYYDVSLTYFDKNIKVFRKNDDLQYAITENNIELYQCSLLSTKQNVINFINNATSNDFKKGSNKYIINFNNENFYNFSIYNFSNQDEIILAPNTNNFTNPFFDNKTEIENGYPDGVFISRGDYSEDDSLYFHLLKITNTVPDGNQSTYYYEPKVFKLTKDSKYYRTYDADTDNKYSYYYINRSELTLDTNSSYLYVLSNNGNSITNSYGILQSNVESGIFEVIQSDTAGVITEQQALNDKISNINNTQQDISNSQQEIANNSNNINNYLNQNTISDDTNENIDTNLNFNNQNSDLNNLNNGFFTRLTTMLSNISNYDLQEDSVINIPMPNSQKYLELHSIIFYNNVTGGLRTIINAFWTFIFTFYLWKFINKIFIAVSSGSILDNFSSSGEAITNNML